MLYFSKMSNHLIIFISSLLLFVYVCEANPASFITKCKAEDTKCLKTSSQAAIPTFADGIPELGIGPMDPLIISKIDASSPSLKLVATDVVVKGLKGCIVKKVTNDLEKSKIFFKVLCDAELDGDYEMKGQLLIIPIEGKGKVHCGLKKMLLSVELFMSEKVGKDGKNHWDIKSWKHNYTLEDKSDVVFENLFDGNEVLAQAAREVIANNGNDIIKEIGLPVVEAVGSKIVSYVNRFFHKVPLEDLVRN